MKMKRLHSLRPALSSKWLPALLLFAGCAEATPSASAANYVWTNNTDSGNFFAGTAANYATPRPINGVGPTAADNLIITGTSNIALQNSSNQENRAVNDLTVSAAASTINPGAGHPPVSFTIHGNLVVEAANKMTFTNTTGNTAGTNGTLDVEVKGNISVETGATLNLGTLANTATIENYFLRSFLVTGTDEGLGKTNINGTLALQRNTKTVSLGDLTIGSAGTVTLSGAVGGTSYDGDFTKEINTRSLSGAGILEGSTVVGTTVTANSTLAITTIAKSSADFSGTLKDGSGTNAQLHLKVAGIGTQTLSGSSSYTGATTVSGATLALSGSGSINNTSAITINNGGTLIQNSTTTLSAPITFTSGTIGGSGAIAADLTIGANRTLSPGNSPGSQTFVGSQTWEADGNYNWQVYDASGVAGVGFDTLSFTGSLNLFSLTSENQFNLNLWSLAGVEPDVNGAAINFDAAQSYSWLIATADLISFSGNINDLFQLNLGAFNGTSGFQNSFDGSWSVSVNGANQQLFLNYTAVPEPGSMVLLSAGLAAMGFALRRKLS